MSIRKPDPQDLPSNRTLLLASVSALLVLVVLVVVIILPAEKGIDITTLGDRLNLTRMGQIKVAMAEEDAPVGGRPSSSDEISFTIPEGQGMEVKLEMKKGFVVDYSWTTSGALVSHDTHGDPYVNKHIYVTYSRADEVNADSGSIEAVYSGFHGWYWENKGDEPVTITLKTNGEYLELIPM